jgi:hypothetical protein
LGKLLRSRQVRKMISSYVGENKEFERQYLAGELEVEFCPRARSPSAAGRAARAFPGFYTKTGVGTIVAEGKEQKEFDGETYILERGIRADLSIIKGWKADEAGNLVFRKTARNFNQPMATAGPGLRRRSGRDRAGRQPRSGRHPPAEHLCEADDRRRALRQEDRVHHDAGAGGGVIAMARIATSLALAGTLGGCIAAAIPVLASSAMVRERMQAKRDSAARPRLSRRPRPTPASGWCRRRRARGACSRAPARCRRRRARLRLRRQSPRAYRRGCSISTARARGLRRASKPMPR